MGCQGCRSCRNLGLPTLEVGKVVDVLSLSLGVDPGIAGHIGDGIGLAGEETPLLKPPVHDSIEAVGLVQITLGRIRNLLLCVETEVMVLPPPPPPSSPLPEQPIEGFKPAAQFPGPKIFWLLAA